jgi:hypothetical protein
MSRSCICEFDTTCAGNRVRECSGCGGDHCICRCGGEVPCEGCEACFDEWDELGLLDEETDEHGLEDDFDGFDDLDFPEDA